MAFKLLEMVVDLVCAGQSAVSQALQSVAAGAGRAAAAARPLASMAVNIAGQGALAALGVVHDAVEAVVRSAAPLASMAVNFATGPALAALQGVAAAAGRVLGVTKKSLLELQMEAEGAAGALPGVAYFRGQIHGAAGGPAPFDPKVEAAKATAAAVERSRQAQEMADYLATDEGKAHVAARKKAAAVEKASAKQSPEASLQQVAGVAGQLGQQFTAATGAGGGLLSTLGSMAAAGGPAGAAMAGVAASIAFLGEASHTFATVHDDMVMMHAEMAAMGKDADAVMKSYHDLIPEVMRMGVTYSEAKSIIAEASRVTDGSREAMENYTRVAVGLGRAMHGDMEAGKRLALSYGDKTNFMQPERLQAYLRAFPELRREFTEAGKRGEYVGVTIERIAQRGLDMQDVYRKDTFSGSFDKMTGALEQAWDALSRVFGPQVIEAINDMAKAVTTLADAFTYLTVNADGTRTTMSYLVEYLGRFGEAVATLGMSEIIPEAMKVWNAAAELFESEADKKSRLAKDKLGKAPTPGVESMEAGFESMQALSDRLANAAYGQKGPAEETVDELRKQTKIQEEQLEIARRHADIRGTGGIENYPVPTELPGP